MGAALNRRAMIGAIGMGAVAGTALALTPATANPGRAAWDRAFAKMERAKAAYDAFEARYEAACAGFRRDAPNGEQINLRPISPIIAPSWRHDILHKADLDAMHAKFIADEGTLWSARDRAAKIAEHKAACDAVRKFRTDYQAAKDRHQYDQATQRNEDLCNAMVSAQFALIEMPAPTLAELLWKLQFLFGAEQNGTGEYSDGWAREYTDALIADARRFSGEA